MHPWMNPFTETKLWSHEYNPIYEAYNRIFDCRGHGWSNLQSTHINLPFNGDEEFAKLHAAIRFLMPIMPALTASSPIADGKITGQNDFRLHTYRSNSKRVPMVTGSVIPEPVFSKKDYETEIFAKMYEAIAPHDPDSILQEEWLNSRGAIARFDRGAIEIRILDIQECPAADIAISELICTVLKQLVNETYAPIEELKNWTVKDLDAIYTDVCKNGEESIIRNEAYLRCLGFNSATARASDVWDELYENSGLISPEIEIILDYGSLSSRILESLSEEPDRNELETLYRKLADCLQTNTLFVPDWEV
jgi:carboxylate-amine ligase